MRHGIMLQSIGLNADRSGESEREISFPMFSMKNATRQIISLPPRHCDVITCETIAKTLCNLNDLN